MIKPPPKPKFESGIRINHGRYDDSLIPAITESAFNQWYDREIKPLFENAVEVYGDGRVNEALWSTYVNDCSINRTHKALLINIQEIKSETAEDILRELANSLEHIDRVTYKKDTYFASHLGVLSLLEKARKYLERK